MKKKQLRKKVNISEQEILVSLCSGIMPMESYEADCWKNDCYSAGCYTSSLC